jgi:hypothetical protein
MARRIRAPPLGDRDGLPRRHLERPGAVRSLPSRKPDRTRTTSSWSVASDATRFRPTSAQRGVDSLMHYPVPAHLQPPARRVSAVSAGPPPQRTACGDMPLASLSSANARQRRRAGDRRGQLVRGTGLKDSTRHRALRPARKRPGTERCRPSRGIRRSALRSSPGRVGPGFSSRCLLPAGR